MARRGGNDYGWVGYVFAFVVGLIFLALVLHALSSLSTSSQGTAVVGPVLTSILGIFGILGVIAILIGGVVTLRRGGWSASARGYRRIGR
jgi:hypothetical protein